VNCGAAELSPGSRGYEVHQLGKVRPGSPTTPNASPMALVSASPCRPLLSVGTVRHRCYGHAVGTAGEDDVGSSRTATVTSSAGG
jgi:hypothetical protein